MTSYFQKQIYHSYLIRLVLEGYIEIVISSYLNIVKPSEERNWSEDLTFYFAIVAICFSITFSLAAVVFLYVKRASLDDSGF